MDIARYSINNPVNTWLLILICLVGGVFAYLDIERLEDPAFVIKEAVVMTPYPGASAEEVEREVSDVLERAVQQMPQLGEVRTRSMAGLSEMRIEILDTYRGPQIPQIWDELRRRIGDARGDLPPGAYAPIVNDNFGDVFGIYYAITGDGLTRTELYEAAKALHRGLRPVEGVGQIEIAGMVQEQFLVEIPQASLEARRIAPEEIALALDDAQSELHAGGVPGDGLFLRISPSGAFDSLESLRALAVGSGDARVRLGDIADIRRVFEERPSHTVFHDGREAVTIGIAGLPSVNIVEVGANVDAALERLMAQMPIGIELHPIYDQPQVVDDEVGSFVFNLFLSLAIVIAVLCVVMGVRAGLVIGAIVLLSVGGTLVVMNLLGLELERVSLAALIIAMGMLVDNALVICDGIQVRMKQGRSAMVAASRSVQATRWALLGATVIGILAFAGIGLSQDSTGEFMFSLFVVIAVSLLLSWILAVTVLPMLAYRYLATDEERARDDDAGDESDGGSVFQGKLFQRFRRVMDWTLDRARLTVAVAAAITLACAVGFGFLPQSFFPPASTPIGFVDINTRAGSDVRATSEAAREVDAYIRETFDVAGTLTLVGQGATRFILTYGPAMPDAAYAQVMVMVDDADDLDAILSQINREAAERFPDLEVHGERLVFGAATEARIEARFSGDSPEVLRGLSARAQAVMRGGDLLNVRDDWRQRELLLRPRLDPARMAEAGVTRQDVAQALMTATDGIQLAVFRDEDELRPVLLRVPESERVDAGGLLDRAIWASLSQRYVRLSDVADGVEAVQVEANIQRRDRQRVISVRGEPHIGEEASMARQRIVDGIEAIELPPGYTLAWGGEHEESSDAQGALFGTLLMPYLAMILITVLMFARVRQPLLIWALVPMSICGVTVGLAISGFPFGFVALLGLISLTGLLLKNAIVLVEEIDRQIAEGVPRRTAIVEGTTSRLSPVVLLCATTLAGMVPLLPDPLFGSMAVSIMGGLLFATVLTLLVLPALYALFFKIGADETVERDA